MNIMNFITLETSLSHPNLRVLRKALRVLREGGIILYPTETSYALGCDAGNSKARVRIFKIKGRSKSKELPLIVGSEAMARRLYRVNALAARLMKKYWPGPLTLLLDARRGGKSAAIRVPGSVIARVLSRRLGRPIVSTSANLSGKQACFSARTALRQLRGKGIDLVLDAGRLHRRKPSAIVDARCGQLCILRRGSKEIKKSDIN